MNATKRVFKWFWAWNDKQEERWLTQMAQQGWHLQSPGLFGFYTFEQGAPRNVTYRLDFKTAGKDEAEYLQLFADAGWEHLGDMGGWQYFRKETVEGETPEIYTDRASKAYKYQRILLFLIILLPVYLVVMLSMSRSSSAFMQVVSLVSALLMLLYVYALVRVFLRMLKLRE
jgi:hypothetical protein